ncbi:MAG: glycosyltransferase family 2 protein [Solirubrobacterales bacterium]|nr:glycosyltransferase family 2 protein [Solirubrobacterales bacterium]
MITASVVICAYTLDRWDDLCAAVASAVGQVPAPSEVIVVIDGNEELLARAEAAFPQAVVLRNAGADGLSGGRETGAARATAPVVAFLDDDAIAEPGWLRELLAAYADPHVLGAGGHVEPLWRAPQPVWFPAEFNWVVGCTWAGMEDGGDRIRNPIGANMSMRADVIRRTGAFKLGRISVGGRVSGSAEETEYCIRASRLHPGGYWVHRPAARVRHVVVPERGTWAYFVRRCRIEGAAKALLTDLAGTQAGLASERRYVRSVLPRAVAGELRAALRERRPGALRRAGAIVAGVGITTWAYATTSLAQRARRAG